MPSHKLTSGLRSISLVIALTLSGVLIPVSAQSQASRPPITAENGASISYLGVLDTGIQTVTSIAFAPDGKHLLSAHPKGVLNEWDLSSGKNSTLKLPDAMYVNAVIYAPEGHHIIATDDKDIVLWEADSKEQTSVFKGHEARVLSLAITTDGKTLASGGVDGTITLWDMNSGKQLRQLKAPGGVEDLAFSSDSLMLASIDGNTAGVNLWEVTTGKSLKGLTTDKVYYNGIAYSADGALLVATAKEKVDVWNMKTKKLTHSLTPPHASLTDIVFNYNSAVFTTGSDDGAIQLWDAQRGSGFSPLTDGFASVTSLAFTTDGTLFASGHADGLIYLWGISEGGPLPLPALKVFTPKPGHWAGSQSDVDVSFDINADGKLLNFKWKRTLGTSYCSYQHAEPIALKNNTFSFSPDGQTIKGKFRSPTSLFGTSPSTSRCGNMVFMSTGGALIWWVKHTGS